MAEMFRLITPITYWILIVLWSFILWFYVKKMWDSETKQLFYVLVIILAIDAFRTLFESVYFGLWYTSLSGLIPLQIGSFLTRPELVIVPKIINVGAAIAIIVLLLKRWLPREEQEQKKLGTALHESEEEFRAFFENNPVSSWLEDFSEVKKRFDVLREAGISDITSYLDEYPEEIGKLSKVIKIKDVNQATLDLHKAENKEQLYQGLETTFTPESFEAFRKEIVDLWNGKVQNSYDGVVKTLDGEFRYVQVSYKILPGYEKTFLKVIISIVDNTQKWVAEQKLLESEASLRDAQRIANIGNWWLDLQTGAVEMSDEMLNLIGVKDKREIVNVTSHEKYYTPESWRQFTQVLETAKNKGTSYEIEMEFSDKDAKFRHAVARGEAIHGESSTIIGLKGTLQDITVQKQTDMALQKNYHLLERITDNMFDLVSLSDLEGRFTFVGKSHERILGYTTSELIGKNVIEFVHPDDFSHTGGKLESVLRTGGPITAQFRYKHKEGNYFWFETVGELLRDENNAPDQIIFSTRDITERKKAEEILKENEQRYKSAQRMGNVGNWEYDLVTEKFWGSDQTKRIYGFDPLSDKFTTDEVENRIPDRERVHQALVDLIEKNTPYNLEFDIHPITGPKTRTIRSIAEVLKDDSGAPLKVTGVIQDITDQQKAFQEKEKLERRLRQGQKMESIGTLAGGIAHDFNNILSSVLGFTELALDTLDKDAPIKEDLQEVYAAGLRAKDLVHQILTFARQSDEEMKPVQVDYIISEVLKFIRSSTPTSIDIKQHLESQSFIMGSATQLHQIMMNLCTNGAHAMEDTGGILEITLKDTTLDSASGKGMANDRNYLEIKVSDTGIGIEPHVIEKIFEPYFTTKKPGEGTGMGLAMVHGIVESFGGKIIVASKVGRGTAFTIYFPICKSSKTELTDVSEELPKGQERILFVDDEVQIAKIGSRILDQLGYSVTSMGSSIEALELFQRSPNDFDLVISDVTMPGMTGDDLAIKLMQIRPDIPVILLTGYSKKLSEEKALEIGVKAFAAKPIVKAVLATTVRKVLDDVKRSNLEEP
ncbi:MAG: PAS domain S-box-containing protein [Desulforhopalus sp.]|jgi:PAS domain S-box-containing protein